MAYLIHANHWTLSRAYTFVLERRKGISPDEPAETDVDILHDIRDLLRAQQSGTTAPPAA